MISISGIGWGSGLDAEGVISISGIGWGSGLDAEGGTFSFFDSEGGESGGALTFFKDIVFSFVGRLGGGGRSWASNVICSREISSSNSSSTYWNCSFISTTSELSSNGDSCWISSST